MTRKHFEAIAAILNCEHSTENDRATRSRIATDLASYFATVNPNFNRAKFLKACGL